MLERAGVEVQPEATWAQVRPLYDDLIKQLCENLRKSTEENVEKVPDNLELQKPTAAANGKSAEKTTEALREQQQIEEFWQQRAQQQPWLNSQNGKNSIKSTEDESNDKIKQKPVHMVHGTAATT